MFSAVATQTLRSSDIGHVGSKGLPSADSSWKRTTTPQRMPMTLRSNEGRRGSRREVREVREVFSPYMRWKNQMNLYSQPYSGRKRSRTCRFPALAQDRMRAITSALPCRCEGIRDFRCDRALPLPASSGHKPANILYRRPTHSHHVTMCRQIIIEIETVRPDRAKTDANPTIAPSSFAIRGGTINDA